MIKKAFWAGAAALALSITCAIFASLPDAARGLPLLVPLLAGAAALLSLLSLLLFRRLK